MDTATVTSVVKELNDASTANNTDDLTKLLNRLKSEIEPTEEILRTAKLGVAVGKLRTHATSSVASLAKDLVKKWKDVIDENKKKRKRDDGDGKVEDGVKRVKGEGSNVSSPGGSDSKLKTSPERSKTVKSEDKIATAAKSESNTPTSPKSPPQPQRRPSIQIHPLSTIDSTRTTPRTAKSDNAESRCKTDGGDPVRDKCVVLIYDALAGDSNAERNILVERALAIEKAVFELLNESTGNDYRGKMRSLYLNLKDKGNPGLRNEIVLGYLAAADLVKMSKDEMASESVRMLNEKIASDNLFKAKSVGETQAETDAFKCGRCQQRKCTYYQMQTRSADEPMTTFVTCTNCGNRWKFS